MNLFGGGRVAKSDSKTDSYQARPGYIESPPEDLRFEPAVPQAIFIVARGPNRCLPPPPMSAWLTREQAIHAAGSEDRVVEYRLAQSYKLVLTPE